MRTRVLVAILVVAGVAGLWRWLDRPLQAPIPSAGGPPLAGRPLKLTQSADCKTCHAEVYDEWRRSHHALAYVNPEVQSLSKNFRDRECLPCHAPQPVFETGIENRALERQVRLEDGVDCFACHKHHDAILGGAHVNPQSTADCNPRPWAPLGDVALCAPCHDQHKVVKEWRQTEYAVPGPGFKDCAACHQPPGPRAAAGRPAYVGKSHLFAGAHDADYLRSAATFRAEFASDGALEVEIKNVGAGHPFPNEERHRSVDLVLMTETEDGAVATALVDRYRNPYRDEFHLKNPLRTPGATREYPVELGLAGNADVKAARIASAFNPNRVVFFAENTQIPAGEARRYRITFPRGVRKATLRVYYKLKPPATYDEATLLFERPFAAIAPGPGVFGKDGFLTPPEPSALKPAAAAPAVKPRDPVVALAEKLLDPALDAPGRAARILELGAKPENVPLLRYVMKDKSQSAFVVLDDPSTGAFSIEENPFGDENDRSLERIAAIAALERAGGARALPELLLALDDRDKLVGVHAARALAHLGLRAGVPVLIDAMDGKAYASEHANRFLKELSGEDLGFSPDIGMTKKAEAARRWREWWTAFSAGDKRLRGEGAPYRRGADPEADRRVAAYVDLLGGFQFIYMEQSRKMLRRLGPEAVPFLRDALPRAQGGNGATWRGGMAQVLAAIPGADAAALLAALRADAYPGVRSRAVEATGERGGPDAADAVRALLVDPDATVVAAAARTLAVVGDAADAARLDALAQAASDLEVRVAARCSAYRLQPTAARFDALGAYVVDPSIVARTGAIDAMNAALGRKVVEDPLAAEDERKAALAVWRTAIK